MVENFKTSILLVEDEAIIALKEKKDLERYGYSVHYVTTGEKAVQTIVENTIPADLILMDINLGPGIDGTQAAELILNHKDIPVVFLSSHTEPEIVGKTEKITSYGYVVKNSSITVLDASIKMAMKLSDAKIKHNLKEAALVASEKRFYELFERAPLGYQSLDNDGKFLTVNQAWLETLGYNRDEVVGKWFGDFLAPEYVQPFRERFPLFKAQGHIYSEFFMVHKNGGKRYIAFDGRVGHHEDGSFKQTHCILKDETERKRIEIELAESLERFRALHNASFGGIAIHDKGIILECNQGLSEMFGYSVNELIGMNGLLLIAPDNREMVMNKIVTGYEQPYEAQGLRKNGEQFPIRLEARNVPYKGKNVRTVEFRDLTESRHVQAALQKSEAFKDKIVSNIGDVIVIIDEKGINRYKSPNITRLFGWDPEELVGKNTWDTIHPDDLEAAQKLFLSILSEPGASAKTELRYKRKDGNYVWIEINVVNLLHDEDIQGILGDYHDITESKQAEEKRIENETLYRNLLENSIDAVYLFNEEGKILQVNGTACSMLGYSREELLQLTFDDIVIDYTPQQFINLWNNNEETSILIETTHRHKNGQNIPIEFNGIFFTLTGEKFLFGIARNLTERKRQEALVKNSEEKYRLLFHNSNDAIFVHEIGDDNLPSKNIEVNQQASRMLGYTREELLNLSVKDVITKKYAPTMALHTRELFEKKHLTFESENIKSDGTEVPVEVSAFLFSEGDKRFVISSVRDITDRKKAEKEIEKQLSEKEALLQEVHHRVKNNISHISGLLSLQIDSTNNSAVKEALQEAISRVESMGILYQKLLMTNRYQKISMQSYTESLLDSLSEVFFLDASIKIEKNITDFEIDANKAISIGIIINELMTNVFKYAFKNRNNGNVNLSIGKEDNTVTLIIQDNGNGFDEKTLNNQSTGFGLTLVELLVEQLEGTYRIMNEKGARSILQFEL